MWILFIIFNFITIAFIELRAKKFIKNNPALKIGYSKFINSYILFSNIPWIIIGIGNFLNYTNSIEEYFHPRLLNPFVLLFHFYIVVIIGSFLNWIYHKNGAEFLEKHPGIIMLGDFMSGEGEMFAGITAQQIKFLFGVSLPGAIIALIMMWFLPV